MANIETVRQLGPADLPASRSDDKLRPAAAEPPPIVRFLVLFGLFAGCIGFWVAVIAWI